MRLLWTFSAASPYAIWPSTMTLWVGRKMSAMPWCWCRRKSASNVPRRKLCCTPDWLLDFLRGWRSRSTSEVREMFDEIREEG
jgi:hypothetical protein